MRGSADLEFHFFGPRGEDLTTEVLVVVEVNLGNGAAIADPGPVAQLPGLHEEIAEDLKAKLPRRKVFCCPEARKHGAD